VFLIWRILIDRSEKYLIEDFSQIEIDVNDFLHIYEPTVGISEVEYLMRTNTP
jgi:hypothetical protein